MRDARRALAAWLAAALPLRACSTAIAGLRASRREEGANQAGHIFVMNTDLRFLACDAWLCPVSETMELSPHWQRSIRACELPERPHDWGISTSGSATGTRVVRCRPRTEAALRRRREERYKQYEHPEPYLALVMGRGLSVAQRAQTLHEFLDKVSEELAPTSRFGRALPLVAVPILGAGMAAEDVLRGDDQSGELITAMLRELHAFASRHACDVALCTVDPSAFGAAQQARRRPSRRRHEAAGRRRRRPPRRWRATPSPRPHAAGCAS